MRAEACPSADGRPTSASSRSGRFSSDLTKILQEVRKLKLGSNLTSFVAPASFMLPFSTTELTMHGTSFGAVGYAAAVRETDAARRMARILGAHLAALSETLTVPMRKPYNPVLGELLVAHGSGAELEWRAAVEQVSHHPPLTAFHVEGRSGHGAFRHYGSSGAVPLFRGNWVEVRMTVQPGATLLTLEDGTEEAYVLQSQPSLCMRGVMGLGRCFCEWAGELRVECATSGLVGRIDLPPARPFSASGTTSHVTGSVTPSEAATHATALYHISGAWADRVVARPGSAEGAISGEAEIELLPAAAAGVRPVAMSQLPAAPSYTIPAHSRCWARHPHAVWAELTKHLQAHDWAAARAAKRRVEEAERAISGRQREERAEWRPALFERVPPAGQAVHPHAAGWRLRDGVLDHAFDSSTGGEPREPPTLATALRG